MCNFVEERLELVRCRGENLFSFLVLVFARDSAGVDLLCVCGLGASLLLFRRASCGNLEREINYTACSAWR